MGEWIAPLLNNIPDLLRNHARWLLWSYDGAGKKAPRDPKKKNAKAVDSTKSANWSDWETAKEAQKHGVGLGFALGPVQDGPAFAGVDLDHCRDPQSGMIESWAKKVIEKFSSYTEISPSGTGVKIFITGALQGDNPKQGKIFHLEMYDRGRYFTVTGQHLLGTPTTVEFRQVALQELHDWAFSRDLIKLVKLFDLYISQGPKFINIHCPWEEGHSGKNQDRDAGLRLDDHGKVAGFECFHASCKDRNLGDVRKFFGMRGADTDEWNVDRHDNIIADDQENIRHAIDLLEVKPYWNAFTDRPHFEFDGQTKEFNDGNIDRLYLNIETKFKFRASIDYFTRVLYDYARRSQIHPVQNYLKGLMWDGKQRIDNWLVTYAHAKSDEYVRAVGALVLVAAVRRVFEPGCKFDELLILESGQGFHKSSAIKALVPNEDWFGDDLPLNSNAKEVIERTGGKWIIEAQELSGAKSAHVEHLKAFLSRSADGPARLAYKRNPDTRKRSFILIGTTNSYSYLKDSTGNRRFWPVHAPHFQLEALARDRDQLWAEAMLRHKAGASIRLPEDLWKFAAEQQEVRRIRDPWEIDIEECFQDDVEHRISEEEAWMAVKALDSSRRTQEMQARLDAVLHHAGFVKKVARPIGGGKAARLWCRSARQLSLHEDKPLKMDE